LGANGGRGVGSEGGATPYRDDPRMKVVTWGRSALAEKRTDRWTHSSTHGLGLIATIALMIRPRCSAASRVPLASLGGCAALDPACAP
jgi:hypothetical protein